MHGTQTTAFPEYGAVKGFELALGAEPAVVDSRVAGSVDVPRAT